MFSLYPPIKSNYELALPVDSPHILHVEECGNPQGLPVIVLHNGPGTGCDPHSRRYFDPKIYKIILFDQRGAGRSTPHAELKNNNTDKLITDIETIRQHFGINTMIVFGYGWGATLALLYAQQHPEHVSALILGSVFLARPQDIYWIYQQGANQFFPEDWEDFINHLSPAEQKSPLEGYHQRLWGEDELVRMSAAKTWSKWQARCATFNPSPKILDYFRDPHLALGLACLENHYFLNQCFITDNQVLENIEKIQHIPGYIIHGRYDVLSPLNSAWLLHRAWSNSQIYVIREAGHDTGEASLVDALIIATREAAKIHSDRA